MCVCVCARARAHFLTVRGCGPSTPRCQLEPHAFHWLHNNRRCKQRQHPLDRERTVERSSTLFQVKKKKKKLLHISCHVGQKTGKSFISPFRFYIYLILQNSYPCMWIRLGLLKTNFLTVWLVWVATEPALLCDISSFREGCTPEAPGLFWEADIHLTPRDQPLKDKNTNCYFFVCKVPF